MPYDIDEGKTKRKLTPARIFLLGVILFLMSSSLTTLIGCTKGQAAAVQGKNINNSGSSLKSTFSLPGLEKWKNIEYLNFKELQNKYIELIDYTKPYIIREEIKSMVIPSGVPKIYGKELGVEFDAGRANYMIAILRKYENEKLNDEQAKRYIAIGRRTACEYCCRVKALVKDDGTRACGCAHSFAMRGLAKYLILNHPKEYTDDEILKAVNEWKVFFFPKQSIEKVLKTKTKSGEIDPSVLQEMPNMIGGC